MQVLSTVETLRRCLGGWRDAGQRIGFVATMGNLHAGHLALLKEAARHSDRIVASIFVNPLQFNEQGDLDAYPRTFEQDVAQLQNLGVDALFSPDENGLYPQGREAITRVEVGGLSDILEGAARPGHFAGVTTVVAKLFNCVQPNLAVFGEKDFQQLLLVLLLVRRLVADLNMPIEVIGLPTVREVDGLAMSSRNQHLNAAQRKLAPQLYQQLQAVRTSLLTGNRDYSAQEQTAVDALENMGFEPDYVAIRDADRLSAIDETTQNQVILMAARLGQTRLIDNLRV